MPQVEIISEKEFGIGDGAAGIRGRGWEFDCQILDDEGRLKRITLRLSWADYNVWSVDGSDEPSKVAEAALMFLLTKQPVSEWRESFDAGRVRVRFGDADRTIPGMIR